MDVGTRLLRSAAESGSALAKFKLGLKFEQGCGVKKDCAGAAQWYRKAAD